MVKFHCCVVPTVQCRGTARPKKVGMFPEKPAPHCVSVAGAPFPSVQLGAKPVKCEDTATKGWVGAAPRGGMPGKPVAGFGANRLAKPPGPGGPPKISGK